MKAEALSAAPWGASYRRAWGGGMCSLPRDFWERERSEKKWQRGREGERAQLRPGAGSIASQAGGGRRSSSSGGSDRMGTPGPGVRSTRRLRQWTVEQVESGKFRGLVWDNPEKTMFRIPWKHAGKQEFRQEEDASFFKAWAVFKGKYRPGERFDPAACKTRIRCALSKSPEFEEVPSRSKLDITEPYKVYRLVPLSEQQSGNSSRKSKKRKVKSSSGTSEEGARSPPKVPCSLSPSKMDGSSMAEVTASPSPNAAATLTLHQEELSPQPGETAPDVTEIALRLKTEIVSTGMPQMMRIGEAVGPSPALDGLVPFGGEEFSIRMSIFYSGVLVQSVWLPQGDFRITSAATPLGALCNRMHPVMLPHPDEVEDPQKQEATSQLLKALEKGVMAESNREGIFIQCQTKCKASVSWQGLSDSVASGKLGSDTLRHVFSAKAFRSAWDQYLLGLAPKPEHQVTLCIGEELKENDRLDNKLIVIQMAQNFAARMVETKQMPALESFIQPFEFLYPSA
ncbi:interferon regulatory factor 9 isoform X2 [Paroedura picta]|uniref:interferon regulatory factor 9 isoform X2 n=1 Tax=Paroedura picta TaxID=143630 RepID=UPI004057A562